MSSRTISPLRTKPAVALAAVALAVLAGLLGGCARKAGEPATSSASQLTVVAPANVGLMTAEDKASRIASDFPPQIPVPAGEVLNGEAQGMGAWDYQIVVPGSTQAVIRWYLDAYANAEWSVASRSGNAIELVKNGAQTRLEFSPADGAADKTKVVAVVGVGAPVLVTQ